MGSPHEGRQSIILTLKDVTDLHEAAQRLEQSERKYRELVNNANSIIIRLTPDHTITFFNEYAQRFFGYQPEEVLGRNVVGTIVPEIDSDGRDLREMLRAISSFPELYTNNENEAMCKDGRRTWIHWTNRAVRDGQGNIAELLCVGTDISRRREMEAQALKYQQRLHDLAERLATAEEKDRWRISRYIHDTIIQNLSLSSIRLAALVKPLTDARLETEVKTLGQTRELLNQALDECRTVMADLTPALLYELGLVSALHELADRLRGEQGADMVVEGPGQEVRMSNSLRGLLFQSVRELVMNALKYAGPCTIRVAVSCCGNEVSICVADNGKGFDPAAEKKLNHRGGFGLFNIQLRLEGLGGRMEIESAPGNGTTAKISVPLQA
jgi:PAS domain S-box-containing protein